MTQDVQNQINIKICRLPLYHQLAFGVMLSERYLPNYFAFYLSENWGNPMVLLNGIDLLKSVIANKQSDPEDLELIDDLIESVTPDLEDFPGNPLASLALDVSSMLAECFAFVRNQNPRHIELCSAISFSSLELYLQVHEQYPHDLSAVDLDTRLAKHPLMREELEYQLELLKDLSPEPKINSKLFMEKTLQAPKVDWAGLGKMVG
jgi:uncharacterized protein YjaG (DUF416 family)